MDRIAQLEEKWSERFNRLEALLLSKSLQPTFSSEVQVTPSHSPLTTVARETEPFFQPTSRVLEDLPSHQRTGPDFSAAQQLLAGKLSQQDVASGSSSVQRTGPDSCGRLPSEDSASGSSTVQRTGPDTTALKLKSDGKLKSEHHRPRSSTRRTGPDTTVLVTHKSTGKPHTESHRPTTQNISTSFTEPPSL